MYIGVYFLGVLIADKTLRQLEQISNELYVIYESFGYGFLFDEEKKSYIYSIFVSAGFRVVSITYFMNSKYLHDDVILIDTLHDTYIIRRSHLSECVFIRERKKIVEKLVEVSV